MLTAGVYWNRAQIFAPIVRLARGVPFVKGY
jgi:hypothetical protein